MQNIIDKIVILGKHMEYAGWKIMPISFIAYFILGIIGYNWDLRHYSKLVKAVWYLLNAILVISGDVKVNVVAVMILFFEAYDNILDYFEEKKNKKKN